MEEKSDELTRCFVSIDLPQQAIAEIVGIQDRFRKNNLFKGKFTDPAHLHLTLKFLGEIDDEKVEEVEKKLADINLGGFEAEFGEVGIFSKHFIRIIWIELKGKEIFELQKLIDEKLEGLFEAEARFMNHITIARVKHIPNKKRFLEYLESVKPKKLRFDVDSFIFKKSELFREGPVYSEIRKYNLESQLAFK